MVKRSALLAARRADILAGVLLVGALITSGAMARRSLEPSAQASADHAEAWSGLIHPTDVITIAEPGPVAIAEVMVALGDAVSAGQPLARRSTDDLDRQLAQLALDIARAEQEVQHREQTIAWLDDVMARLVSEAAAIPGQLALAERDAQQVPVRQAKDSPERAQVALEQAQARLARMERLASEGIASRQDVEEARFAVRMAGDDLENARRAAAAADRVRSAEAARGRAERELSLAEHRRQKAEEESALERARLELRAAQLRHEDVRAENADPFIRAPREGVILELGMDPGDRLPAAAVLARIARVDPMTIDIDVPPRIVNALRVGGAARADVPAVGIIARDARIRAIAPLPNDAGKYVVQLELRNPQGLRLGGQVAQVWLAPR